MSLMPQSPPPAAPLHFGGPTPGQSHWRLHPLAKGEGPAKGVHRDEAVHRGQAEDAARKPTAGEWYSKGRNLCRLLKV